MCNDDAIHTLFWEFFSYHIISMGVILVRSLKNLTIFLLVFLEADPNNYETLYLLSMRIKRI